MRATFLLRFLPAGLLICVTCSAPDSQISLQKATQVDASSSTFPHFERVMELETAAATSANVSIGDVNGDGNLDLVLPKGRHWPLVDRVLLGDGHGQTMAEYDLGTAFAARSEATNVVYFGGPRRSKGFASR